MFFSRKGFFFQDDEIYGFHVLTIFNCKWGSMRISLWDEILDLQARSTQPVPGTIILIKFIFVKDSIQCFLCTSCARLQRPHCTRRFASSIYRLASIVDIIRIDRAQFSILFLLPSGIVNEGKFVWINKRKWYRFLGIMGWYLWFVYLGHWFWILEEKSKYFFTFHIMFIIHIYMLHIYIYLWGVVAGNAVVRRESTWNIMVINVKLWHRKCDVDDIEDRFERRCFWNRTGVPQLHSI